MKTIGIDVSMRSLSVAAVCSVDRMNDKITGTKTFPNDKEGIQKLAEWGRAKSPEPDTIYIMEATGTYYEQAADILHKTGLWVVVELPNKIKNYAKSLNIKTKTDDVDAKIIGRYALHNKTRRWEPMTSEMAAMRTYSRQILSLTDERTRCKNQLHALGHSTYAPQRLIDDLAERIERLTGYIETYQRELMELANKDSGFAKRVRNVATLKGVSELTVISILCETNGFSVCSNMRQAVSYAGLDVSLYQSGTIRARGRISKKGNARIRRLLFMPAICASHRGFGRFKNLYARVVNKEPNHKMIATIAVERKLYTMIYTLWKKNEPFAENDALDKLQAIDSEKAQTGCKITK